jgi:hypothetical protein
MESPTKTFTGIELVFEARQAGEELYVVISDYLMLMAAFSERLYKGSLDHWLRDRS